MAIGAISPTAILQRAVPGPTQALGGNPTVPQAPAAPLAPAPVGGSGNLSTYTGVLGALGNAGVYSPGHAITVNPNQLSPALNRAAVGVGIFGPPASAVTNAGVPYASGSPGVPQGGDYSGFSGVYGTNNPQGGITYTTYKNGVAVGIDQGTGNTDTAALASKYGLPSASTSVDYAAFNGGSLGANPSSAPATQLDTLATMHAGGMGAGPGVGSGTLNGAAPFGVGSWLSGLLGVPGNVIDRVNPGGPVQGLGGPVANPGGGSGGPPPMGKGAGGGKAKGGGGKAGGGATGSAGGQTLPGGSVGGSGNTASGTVLGSLSSSVGGINVGHIVLLAALAVAAYYAVGHRKSLTRLVKGAK